MSDIADEFRERALFAHRVDAMPAPKRPLDVGDVFARIEREDKRLRRARTNVARIVSQAGTALTAAAACLAIVRGVPAPPGELRLSSRSADSAPYSAGAFQRAEERELVSLSNVLTCSADAEESEESEPVCEPPAEGAWRSAASASFASSVEKLPPFSPFSTMPALPHASRVSSALAVPASSAVSADEPEGAASRVVEPVSRVPACDALSCTGAVTCGGTRP